MKVTFDYLVHEAVSGSSDLEKSVIGLFIFANENASEEEKNEFMSWLNGRTIIDALNPVVTSPEDHFTCADGMSWEDMEEIYFEEM